MYVTKLQRVRLVCQFTNSEDMTQVDIKKLINAADIYGLTPLMLALKNNKNGSIVRLHKHGAVLRQSNSNECDFREISIDLIDAAKAGDFECFMKYSKAGFNEYSKVANMEGKSLAHIVRN